MCYCTSILWVQLSTHRIEVRGGWKSWIFLAWKIKGSARVLSMLTSIWREDVRELEPVCSHCCVVRGQKKTMGTNRNGKYMKFPSEHTKALFYYEGVQNGTVIYLFFFTENLRKQLPRTLAYNSNRSWHFDVEKNNFRTKCDQNQSLFYFTKNHDCSLKIHAIESFSKFL